MLRLLLFKTFAVLLTLITLRSGAQDVNFISSAKSFLNDKHHGLSKLKGLDLIITDQTHNSKNGVTYIYFRQTYQGVEIINANSNMAFKDGKIVHQSGNVISKLVEFNLTKTPSVSATEAIQKVASHLSLSITEPLISETARTDKPNFQQFSNGGISLEPIPVKLVYWQNEEGYLRLAYDLSIYPNDQINWWSIRIDALTGDILEKGDWVSKCQFDLSPHKHGQTPQNIITGFDNKSIVFSGEQYNVYPYPIESPNHGSRSLEISPSDPIFSPFGWHDSNGIMGAEYTITRGNNVHAYEDRANTNEIGFNPDGGGAMNFDFSLDFNQSPTEYLSASITNLFYWNNIIHDIFSHYGFDEQSGNFQMMNYSGQGLGGDAVLAEDQDGSGTNNANFATPEDGKSPRMQMFLWDSNEGGFEMIINSPAGIAGTYSATGASFGPTATNAITGNLALVNDGSANPSEACSTLTNSASISGKIAVIDRGNCSFVSKVKNAQNAGAIAVLMINNAPGDPINMNFSTADKAIAQSITIPVLMVSQNVGNQIKTNLPNVNVTFNDNRKFVTSSFDNGIITHEYGHGISMRLAGGASNSGCLSTIEQMGEGWSDYFGLMLTMKEGDLGSDMRGFGTYAVGETTTGQGIRPAPYSTDFSVNGFTYADLSNENISQPHGIGFIWCTMIWDMTWLLIERHGFDPNIYNGTGGNNLALQLVIDGLKLQPCNPGFVDGRDAILLADRLNNDGANQDIIWEAFARRGLGYNADQGSPDSRTDGVVSYTIPDILSLAASGNQVAGSAGDIIRYELNILSNLPETKTNVNVVNTLSGGVKIIEETLSEGGSIDGTTVNFHFDEITGLATKKLTFEVQFLEDITGTNYSFHDDNENGVTNWISSSIANTNFWNLQSNNPKSGQNAWFVASPPKKSEQILRLKAPLFVGRNAYLAFWHDYNLEAGYDGGVIEISTNNGFTWSDLGNSIIENGYNFLLATGFQNPIEGREAFSGTSSGYVKTIVDLGDYVGNRILLRFRFGSDEGASSLGWYIDDVILYTGETKVFVNEACLTFDGLSETICIDIEEIIILENSVLTNSKELSDNISYYPNPSTGKLTLSFKNQNAQEIGLKVYNLQGQTVMNQILVATAQDFEKTLDLSHLSKGLYILNLSIEGKEYQGRIVIE